MPTLLASKWRTSFYPLKPTRESVDQWLRWIDTQRRVFLGPFNLPDDAAELERNRANDLELIQKGRPGLLAAPRGEPLEASPRTFLATFLSAPDLARFFDLPKDAVEAFLRRHRDKFPDCSIENEAPRKNDPKYLYRTADVELPLKEHFKIGV
jgi:hypothetical protein